MQLRIATSLLRFILFIIVIQLLTPVVIHNGYDKSNTATTSFNLNAKTENNLSLLVLLKENNSEETEENRKGTHSSNELVDFSYVANAISVSHSHNFYNPSQSILFPQPQFDLRCILII